MNAQPKTLQQLARIRQAQLDAAASRPLASKGASDHEPTRYPHVYSSGPDRNMLSSFGQKFTLPEGTTKASYDVRLATRLFARVSGTDTVHEKPEIRGDYHSYTCKTAHAQLRATYPHRRARRLCQRLLPCEVTFSPCHSSYIGF